jgi:hypothetical protein
MSYSASSPILGQGQASAEAIDAWFSAKSHGYAAWLNQPWAQPPPIGAAILAACGWWGPNSDLVAAQIMHESAGWQSDIARAKNNPSGLGAENDDPLGKAYVFQNAAEGVYATVAHLMTYVSGNGAWTPRDPRSAAVAAAGWLGVAHVLSDLDGRWASPGIGYGRAIAVLASGLVDFANNGSWNMQAEIPGFTLDLADPDHYDVGRTAPIRGGAQHYSAGTDSREWLKRTSRPKVSTHLLVKRNATLTDRGWQLVRLKDTAWATNQANPYVVAIEYEHIEGEDIPDGDYEVLSQTWVDVDTEVRRQGLGEILLVHGDPGIQGHKEWAGDNRVCPDGIDVARVVARAAEIAGTPTAPPAADRLLMPPLNPTPLNGKLLPWCFTDFIGLHGGLEVFGQVETGVFEEDGKLVVYTERYRLEYAPDLPGRVQGGLVGAEVLAVRYPQGAPA